MSERGATRTAALERPARLLVLRCAGMAHGRGGLQSHSRAPIMLDWPEIAGAHRPPSDRCVLGPIAVLPVEPDRCAPRVARCLVSAHPRVGRRACLAAAPGSLARRRARAAIRLAAPVGGSRADRGCREPPTALAASHLPSTSLPGGGTVQTGRAAMARAQGFGCVWHQRLRLRPLSRCTTACVVCGTRSWAGAALCTW